MAASKLYTNYDAKIIKGTCGAYIKVISFSGLLHTLRLFWKTATYKQMHVIQKLFGVSWFWKLYIIPQKCSSWTIK